MINESQPVQTRNPGLLFDFTTDKTTNTVFVQKEFAAGLPLIWDAFTKAEILDQWWAPEPWKSETKAMEFRTGGRRFYAMVGPQGEEHYSLQEFTSVSPTDGFRMLCSFTDKDENINIEFPGSDWDLVFSEKGGTTKVSITIKYQNLAVMEQMIAMGFRGGFTMGLNQLEKLLSKGVK